MLSPSRDGHGTKTFNTVVSPCPGGQGPLLEGSLDDGSLLDEGLLEESLVEGSLVTTRWRKAHSTKIRWNCCVDDELLSLVLLLDEEVEEEELDEELLEEPEEEELEEEEGGSSQQPFPSTKTSHLQLSAKCLATPYVPAGTALGGLSSPPVPAKAMRLCTNPDRRRRGPRHGP